MVSTIRRTAIAAGHSGCRAGAVMASSSSVSADTWSSARGQLHALPARPTCRVPISTGRSSCVTPVSSGAWTHRSRRSPPRSIRALAPRRSRGRKAWPSSCRRPPAGSLGFTRAGAERPFQSVLGAARPGDPTAISTTASARDDCERMAMTLSAYNGGWAGSRVTRNEHRVRGLTRSSGGDRSRRSMRADRRPTGARTGPIPTASSTTISRPMLRILGAWRMPVNLNIVGWAIALGALAAGLGYWRGEANGTSVVFSKHRLRTPARSTRLPRAGRATRRRLAARR